MHRGQLADKDLVIAVGGDGTVLNSASFLNSKIPILGIWGLFYTVIFIVHLSLFMQV